MLLSKKSEKEFGVTAGGRSRGGLPLPAEEEVKKGLLRLTLILKGLGPTAFEGRCHQGCPSPFTGLRPYGMRKKLVDAAVRGHHSKEK